MKEELQISTGFAYKKCLYDEPAADIPWLRETRNLRVSRENVQLEPLFDLKTAVGRAFIGHLWNLGILDGYDPEDPPKGSTVFTCVLAVVLQNGERNFHLKTELRFCARDHGGLSPLPVPERDLLDFLYKRLVAGNLEPSMVEIRLKYGYLLKDILSYLDKLELVL